MAGCGGQIACRASCLAEVMRNLRCGCSKYGPWHETLARKQRNLSLRHCRLRLLDVKIGQKTAQASRLPFQSTWLNYEGSHGGGLRLGQAGWQGKSRAAALRQSLVARRLLLLVTRECHPTPTEYTLTDRCQGPRQTEVVFCHELS